MGLRFRRSIKLMPGVRMNISGRGASVSLGGRGARLNVSSRGTRATVDLPGTGLAYTTSVGASRPRRRSVQQLAAAHRRMLQEHAHAQASAEIERMETELTETLNAWRELTEVPSAADYQRALTAAPFENAEAAPQRPDPQTAEELHRREVQQAVYADTHQRPWLRYLC